MHHFGEDSTQVIPSGQGFEVIFTNKTTGGHVRMTVPRSGVFEDPTRDITPTEVEDLARNVAHLLRSQLV